MPLVQVKCPSCGGDIQLDDSREFGFCVYCGAKVMYKEAVQKIEGSVTVEGIAGLEKLLANAETFRKLGNQSKEIEVLTRVTEDYPEDWRGWWRLAQIGMASGHTVADTHGESDPYHLTQMEQYAIQDTLSPQTMEQIRITLRLIPAKGAGSVKKAAEQYWQSCLALLRHEKEKLDNWLDYCNLTDRINQQSADQATAAVEADAEKAANEKVKAEMGKRAARISITWILSITELFLIIWLFSAGAQGSMSTFTSGLWIGALLIIGIPVNCCIYKKPFVSKPYRENYYKLFHGYELHRLKTAKQAEYYQKFLSTAWSAAASKPDLYKEDFLVVSNPLNLKAEAKTLLYCCNQKIGLLTALMSSNLDDLKHSDALPFTFRGTRYDASVRQKTMAYMPQNKIVAIKTLRALTGIGLADANNLIDRWQAGLPQ
jgi:DNA-directed RNA polymerase subunit RPC12/RpoP